MELKFAETFPLLFQQKKVGHCSVYLLANIFRDESLLKYVNQDAFYGCDDKEVNTMLKELDLQISTLMYMNQSLPPLKKLDVYENIKYHSLGEPDTINWYSILGSVYFLTVKLFEGIDMWHHVAIIKVQGNLYYIDPYNENAILINRFSDFENRFYACCQVQMPYIKDTDKWAYIFLDQLGYDKIFQYEESIIKD